MFVTDLTGKQYPAQLTTTLESELNGNQSLSATILPTKVNKAFIDDITEMWTITDHDNVEQRIIHVVRRGKGVNMTVKIKAIPLFFDVMDTQRIERRVDQHMTAFNFFNFVFNEPDFSGNTSGYQFVLNGSFESLSWEGLGEGETRLESFKRGLNRYGAEFRIVGNIVYLHHQIGNDTSHQYRHKLNASNIVQEVDAIELWTYAKGYGDYGDGEGGEDWQNAKLKREYTSPLAKIIGIRHAPPIKNGNITTKAQMDSQLKTLVDESLKISITADIHDLTRQNYPIAQSQLGDRVFVIDERIGLDEEVRIVNKSITRNWRGDILDVNLTFGSEGLAKRHQSNLSTALKNVTDWLTGKKTIPYSIVDEAIKNATQALKNAQTELKFENGILAIDKNDPNKVVIFNSAGVGISNDGGNSVTTAMTGDGVVADVVYTGTLNADRVTIFGGSATEYLSIEGNEIESRGKYTRTWFGETKTHDVGIQLRYGRLRFHNYDNKRNLYFSEQGITTYLGGSDSEDGGNFGSGTIEFFSYRFDPNVRGLTLYSNKGSIGLETEERDIYLDAYRYNVIRARTGYVSINPHINNRPGNNTFRFNVTNNDSSNETDGTIVYGSTTQSSMASGIRFKKARTGEPLIWATDGSGSPATGSFYGRRLYGDLMPRGTFAYVRAPRLRVIDHDSNTNTYGDVQSAYMQAYTLRVNLDGDRTFNNFFIGVSSGELRVVNNATIANENYSNATYRPVRAREFITDTSLRENKRNIDVYDVDVLDILRKADAYLYNRKNDGSYTKKQLGLMLDELPYETYSERGDGFGMYGLVTFLFKGLKQAVEEIDKLKEGA